MIYILTEIIKTIAAAELHFPALKTSFSLLRYERPTVSKEKHYVGSTEVFSSLSRVVMSQQTLRKESVNLI